MAVAKNQAAREIRLYRRLATAAALLSPRRRRCCCHRRRLKCRQRAAAVPLHLAQVLFQAVGATYAAADIHTGGCCCANGLCRGRAAGTKRTAGRGGQNTGPASIQAAGGAESQAPANHILSAACSPATLSGVSPPASSQPWLLYAAKPDACSRSSPQSKLSPLPPCRPSTTSQWGCLHSACVAWVLRGATG